jgi:hypothetical protein
VQIYSDGTEYDGYWMSDRKCRNGVKMDREGDVVFVGLYLWGRGGETGACDVMLFYVS